MSLSVEPKILSYEWFLDLTYVGGHISASQFHLDLARAKPTKETPFLADSIEQKLSNANDVDDRMYMYAESIGLHESFPKRHSLRSLDH